MNLLEQPFQFSASSTLGDSIFSPNVLLYLLHKLQKVIDKASRCGVLTVRIIMSSPSKYLVIVESPAKIKSVGKYLGPEFRVLASFGHFRDLPSKSLAVDTENNFRPTYEITNRKVVRELKQKAATATTIYIATDDDREGHGIAWHIAEVIGMQYPKVRRMTFREITRDAVRSGKTSGRPFSWLQGFPSSLETCQRSRFGRKSSVCCRSYGL
jgi:reverse gyrase